jgi:hypothetical protein
VTKREKVLNYYADKRCRFCGASMAGHAYPAQLCDGALKVFQKLQRSGVRGPAMRAAFTANVIQTEVA